MSNPVQGWYADPAGTGQLRWWDGAQWTDRFQAAPAANAAQAVPQPANTTAQFTPVAQAPATKATGGQIALAVIASLLVVLFLGSSIIATGMHGKAREDVANSQSILDDAKSELQKVQEAIQ